MLDVLSEKIAKNALPLISHVTNIVVDGTIALPLFQKPVTELAALKLCSACGAGLFRIRDVAPLLDGCCSAKVFIAQSDISYWEQGKDLFCLSCFSLT